MRSELIAETSAAVEPEIPEVIPAASGADYAWHWFTFNDRWMEARTVNHVRVTVENGLNNVGNLRRVIFQIGILYNNDFAACQRKAGFKGFGHRFKSLNH